MIKLLEKPSHISTYKLKDQVLASQVIFLFFFLMCTHITLLLFWSTFFGRLLLFGLIWRPTSRAILNPCYCIHTLSTERLKLVHLITLQGIICLVTIKRLGLKLFCAYLLCNVANCFEFWKQSCRSSLFVNQWAKLKFLH